MNQRSVGAASITDAATTTITVDNSNDTNDPTAR